MVDIWDIYEIFDYEIPYIEITLKEFVIAIIITLIMYFVLVKVVLRFVKRGLEKMNMPPLLTGLIARMTRILLIIVVVMIFLASIKINVGSMVLALSAVIGLVIGFGMSDSMNNLFSGIWIAMIRPIRMDEVVTINGMTGKVRAVGIMATELLTPDNIYITIPNKLVWGSAITNYSRMPTRRINLDVGIGYSSPVDKAVEIAMRLMKEHPAVLENPEPSVFITELADSSVNLQIRPWVNGDDYWPTLGELRQQVLETYAAEGIEIPFPQMDVHMPKAAPSPISSM